MTDFKNYSIPEIAQLCLQYGPLLDLSGDAAANIDPVLLLWALAGNESGFGVDCKPRFEPAYFTGGRYAEEQAQVELIAEYGEDAAKSYGPWQLMLVNAPGFTTQELANDAEAALQATVGFLKREIFGRQKAVTLAEVGEAFNGGSWERFAGGRDGDSSVVEAYVPRLQRHYDTPMPEYDTAASGGQ